nr:unnamed protein product [Callosobruchus analis]
MKISRKQRYKLAVLVLALLQTPRYLKESILIQPLAKQNFQKTEFVPRYAKVLLGELKEKAKVELMSTYLPPENVKAFLPITINPEGLKEPLQKTSISESLFGTKLENTIQVAKKLEKLGEQLKLKKIKPPSRCNRGAADGSRIPETHSTTAQHSKKDQESPSICNSSSQQQS